MEQVPIGEGLFVMAQSPSDKPRLLGSKCLSCGEVLFPPQRRCRRCASGDMETVALNPRAKLLSFTKVLVKLPGTKIGPPYLVGIVELPEGECIRTLLAVDDPKSLNIGDEMEVCVDSIYKDESGKEIVGWKFKPVKEG